MKADITWIKGAVFLLLANDATDELLRVLLYIAGIFCCLWGLVLVIKGDDA